MKNFITLFCLIISPLLFSNENVRIITSNLQEQKIEVYFEKPANEKFGMLLFLHGSSGKGLTGISSDWYTYWLNKGYAVAAISLPGYGASSGQKDFCGPTTLQTLHFAIDFIKNELNVSHFGIIGFGQGSTAGLLLSAQRDDIICFVCCNAAYDLFRHKAANDSLIDILKEKNYLIDIEDSQELNCRSATKHADKIDTPLFILHRKGNPIIGEAEVQDFANALQGQNKECHLVFRDKNPGDDIQIISYEEVLAQTEAWVDGFMAIH